MSDTRKRYDKDRIIFREHERGDEAFIILDGEVEILKETEDGSERLRILKKGAMFGEMALIDDETRMASAKTFNGPADLLVIDRNTFKKRLEELDPFSRGLIKILTDKARSNA